MFGNIKLHTTLFTGVTAETQNTDLNCCRLGSPDFQGWNPPSPDTPGFPQSTELQEEKLGYPGSGSQTCLGAQYGRESLFCYTCNTEQKCLTANISLTRNHIVSCTVNIGILALSNYNVFLKLAIFLIITHGNFSDFFLTCM